MRNANRLLPLLAASSFFVGLDAIITAPLLPLLVDSVQVSKEWGALLVSAYAFMYMICAPIFGALSDHRGRRRFILLGLLVLSLGTFLTGTGETFWQLLLFRAVTGLGAGMLQPASMAMAGDAVPYEQRGRAMGLILGALTGSTLFGVPLGTYLAYLSTWRWTFYGMGFFILLLLVIAWLRLPSGSARASASAGTSMAALATQLRAAKSNPSICFALIATFLWFGGLQGMMANIGLYYQQFALNVSQIGLVLMVAGAGSVVGSVTGGKLADRFGKKQVVLLASLLTAAGVFGVSMVSQNVVLAVTLHIFWATAFGLGHAALTALFSELNPRIRGTILSLNSSAMYAGMMASTAISPLFLQSGDFCGIGAVSAAACLLVFPIVRYRIKVLTGSEQAV
ncbi:MFS transporter [Brevibacillus sp. H7]|uniref:MFS transporter n=1 Tax=Brevibacillus sp. H7 TaxID=3349138 RepID=UPI00380AA407